MFGEKKYSALRIFTAITFIIMVVANALANILPINGQTTGEISDSYSNLFAPAGYTFAIWGLIYTLLFIYTAYQLGIFRKSYNMKDTDLLERIGVFFSISSILNTMWIFAWHYNIIWASLILIVMVLISLILINRELEKTELKISEKILIKIPFSIYFGWITVATIANVTTFLVSINWDAFGIAENIWTVVVLFVGFLITGLATFKNRNIVYGATVIWAYTGILMKHISKSGFDGAYPSVISATSIFISLLAMISISTLFIKQKNKDSL